MADDDFNATAPTWQDLRAPRGGDTDVEAWFESQGLQVLNEPNEATRDALMIPLQFLNTCLCQKAQVILAFH